MKEFSKMQKVIVSLGYGENHEGTITQTTGDYPNYSKQFVRVSGIGDPVSVDIVSPVENWENIAGLYSAAYRAYSGTSFSPEKRAEGTVLDHENQLNDDLKNIPETEREQYIANYKKYLFEWLSAKSRCFSSMITGPANFPVRRMEKLNGYEHNKSVQFSEWRERARAAIAKRIEDSKPIKQKQNEHLTQLKKQVDRLFEGWGVVNFRGRLETVAKSGEVETVKNVLEYMEQKQIEKGRVLATPRNSIWKLAELAEANREKEIDKETADSKEYQINGFKVVENVQADRVQIFFDGKPEYDVIQKLKGAAFRWSPSQGCWQRQLTRNGIWATERLLKSI